MKTQNTIEFDGTRIGRLEFVAKAAISGMANKGPVGAITAADALWAELADAVGRWAAEDAWRDAAGRVLARDDETGELG